MLIDARGQGCPKPVMLADDALSQVKEGVVDILVDNEDSALNVAGFAAQHGMFAETSREGVDWRVKIAKGYVCKTSSEPFDRLMVTNKTESSGERSAVLEAAEADRGAAKKSILVVIGTDTLGKDEELGRILMKGFFDTLKVTKQLPHTMLFMNAGVKLTTVNAETIGVLKDIEALGVEIYSCGTCLKFYNLESELKVGKRGTTYHLVEGMQDFEKVVWL